MLLLLKLMEHYFYISLYWNKELSVYLIYLETSWIKDEVVLIEDKEFTLASSGIFHWLLTAWSLCLLISSTRESMLVHHFLCLFWSNTGASVSSDKDLLESMLVHYYHCSPDQSRESILMKMTLHILPLMLVFLLILLQFLQLLSLNFCTEIGSLPHVLLCLCLSYWWEKWTVLPRLVSTTSTERELSLLLTYATDHFISFSEDHYLCILLSNYTHTCLQHTTLLTDFTLYCKTTLQTLQTSLPLLHSSPP